MKPTTLRLVGLSALALSATQCGGLSNFPGGNCPNSAEAAMSASFGLKGEAEGKVKAALAAGASLQALAVELEADVAGACGKLAKDLGASDADIEPKDSGPGKKAEAACQAAVKVLGQVKAKAKGSLRVQVKPPKCSASMEAMADCAGKCDASVEPGKAEVKCEGGEISGKCEGQCKGSCTVEAGAECSGSCSASCEGKCDGEISGKCDGTCNGRCDGKMSGGKCEGVCDGRCSSTVSGRCSGTCSGKCSAACTVKGKAECEGQCSGGCSVELKEPKCSGEVKPPKVSAECKASCDAQVNAKLECQPARVSVGLIGSADVQAAMKLKSALEANLPAIVKVTLGMRAKLQKAVATVRVTLEGARAAVKGGGEAALKAGACLAASIKAQAEASASINVSVKASASASASAGAG
ncbi:MAG: hypothetical protein IPM35_02890 [Myxococcales bacterium]|nr:hypothetical protein [Myxococcales bacterium]